MPQQTSDDLNISLIRHAKGAPGLRILGLGPNFMPCNGMSCLKQLMDGSAFWAQKRSVHQLRQMLLNSTVTISVWHKGNMIGFGRANSDYIFRAVLWDIIVQDELRGMGIGKIIVDSLLNSFSSKKNFVYHVIELSSFQLEFMNNFNPNVSILLNLSKDHLDRYKNYKTYIDQKKKIFSKNGLGYNIISFDDKESMKLYSSSNIKNKQSCYFMDVFKKNCHAKNYQKIN